MPSDFSMIFCVIKSMDPISNISRTRGFLLILLRIKVPISCVDADTSKIIASLNTLSISPRCGLLVAKTWTFGILKSSRPDKAVARLLSRHSSKASKKSHTRENPFITVLRTLNNSDSVGLLEVRERSSYKALIPGKIRFFVLQVGVGCSRKF